VVPSSDWQIYVTKQSFVRRELGDPVRSRRPVAEMDEVLAKLVSAK